MAYTIYTLALVIRGGLHPNHVQSHWLAPPSPLFHGLALIAFNIFIYGWMCWIFFWLIRGTAGSERVFWIGWLVDILTWPIKILWPDWAGMARHIAAVGLAMSLLAGIAILLGRWEKADAAAEKAAQ